MTYSILVAEDDDDTRFTLSRHLRKYDYALTMVCDGSAAVKAAMSGRFDLILMDIHMPVMDGYTAMRVLREQAYIGTIYALTASVLAHEQGKAITAGANGVIAKPIKRGFADDIARIITSGGAYV